MVVVTVDCYSCPADESGSVGVFGSGERSVCSVVSVGDLCVVSCDPVR